MRKHSRVQSKRKPSPKAGRTSKQWIGIDLGDRWSEICVLSDAGEPTERARVRTTPQALEEFFAPFAGAEAAVETGTDSSWVSRTLGECGLTVTVANAREVRKIHQSHRKNDRADAEILARLLRFDPQLLAPILHRSAQMQDDVAVLRARDTLIRSRTMCINSVRGLVKTHGFRLAKCDSDSFAKRAAEQIPLPLQPALTPLLTTIAALTAQIRAYDKHLETLASECYAETALLTQVTGVGTLTALAYVLTLASPQRFSHSRDVGPYLGLVPRQYDSGDQRSQRRSAKLVINICDDF